MEKSLARSKLFGIKKTIQPAVISTANVDLSSAQHNRSMIKKALWEAERKKAEAITILRRYTIVR